MGEEFLSFLHSHNEQILAIPHIQISSLNILFTPFIQLANVFATLRGGHKVEPISMIGHIDLVNWH
jgi:hypothetical protein